MHHIWVCMTSCWHAVPFWANEQFPLVWGIFDAVLEPMEDRSQPFPDIGGGKFGPQDAAGNRGSQGSPSSQRFAWHRVLSPPFPALGNSHDEFRHKHMGRYGQHRNSTCKIYFSHPYHLKMKIEGYVPSVFLCFFHQKKGKNTQIMEPKVFSRATWPQAIWLKSNPR